MQPFDAERVEPEGPAARFGLRTTTMHEVANPVRIEGGVLEDLYLAHASDAVRLAYLLTGDLALAEDLVQDAFVRVAGRLLHLRDAGAFPGYLRRCVVNLASSHGRRKAVERRFLERSSDRRTQLSHDPDAAEREAMRVALLQIPVRNRAAIVLRYYEDLSEAQIAEVLRCRPGTVKSLLSRGMERLRPLISEARDG
jgi:RNA polymerase sigma-70 factor (sigma-E family)